MHIARPAAEIAATPSFANRVAASGIAIAPARPSARKPSDGSICHGSLVGHGRS